VRLADTKPIAKEPQRSRQRAFPVYHDPHIMYTLFRLRWCARQRTEPIVKEPQRSCQCALLVCQDPPLYTTLCIRFFRLRWCARQRTKPIAKELQRSCQCALLVYQDPFCTQHYLYAFSGCAGAPGRGPSPSQRSHKGRQCVLPVC
jgi:hypothetical protein